MRTVTRHEKPEWRKVVTRLCKCTIKVNLDIGFNIHDIPEGVSTYINMFAEAAKLLRKVSNQKNYEELHNFLNKIYECIGCISQTRH